MVDTPFDQVNIRGTEGEERASNHRERVKKVKKITAYGKCFGKLKRILEDAVFHSMYAEQLEDLERHMDKFVNMVQVKCQTAQGELR